MHLDLIELSTSNPSKCQFQKLDSAKELMGLSFSKYFLESVGHLFYKKETKPKPNISSKKTPIRPRLVQHLQPLASFLEPLNFIVHALHPHSQLPSNYGLSLLLL
jgi:hypothetical protein